MKFYKQLSDFAYTGLGQPLSKAILNTYCDYHRNLFQNSVYSSIAGLKKLVELDIQTTGYKNGCTDKSLYQISNLENLRKINLSRFKKVCTNLEFFKYFLFFLFSTCFRSL